MKGAKALHRFGFEEGQYAKGGPLEFLK